MRAPEPTEPDGVRLAPPRSGWAVWPEERLRDRVEAAGGRLVVETGALLEEFGIRRVGETTLERFERPLRSQGLAVAPAPLTEARNTSVTLAFVSAPSLPAATAAPEPPGASRATAGAQGEPASRRQRPRLDAAPAPRRRRARPRVRPAVIRGCYVVERFRGRYRIRLEGTTEAFVAE